MRQLDDVECRHYRDQLRAARYSALADAEGFEEICFALEALGLRLLGQQGDLGKYEDRIGFYARMSPVLNDLAKSKPSGFKTFEALYETVRNARNDNMHAGAYARHATVAAVEHQPNLALAPIDGSRLYAAETTINELREHAGTIDAPTLWLAIDDKRQDQLAGVLSPFELM